MAIPAETIFLDPDSDRTLQQQIQLRVADSILSGRFPAGSKMPSSRALATHLGVARITVTLAYSELVTNDYLTARGRSGFFVSENSPRLPQFEASSGEDGAGVDWDQRLGDECETPMVLARPSDWRSYPYPFIYGQSDPKLFDHQNWRLCAIEALGRKDFDALTLDYYERDDPMLIEYILRQILPRRGIAARPEQILLTMGAQNAIWMTARLLLGEGRHATIENPHYPGLRDVLADASCAVSAVDVDEKGLPPEAIPEGTDMVFTTPSHHCPTNITMPLGRRKELLERAVSEDFLIVEDDYEFEMSFLQPPSPALKSLDRAGSVIYVGSFSKSLFPGLRLGYMVAPERFIEAVRRLRTRVLRHPPGHLQRAVAYYLSLGHHEAQMTRMDKTFRRRRGVMEQAIREHELREVHPQVSGGSSFWMQAPAGVDTRQLALDLREDGVLIEPGDAFFRPEDASRNYYRLAYSSIASARIQEGIARVARALAV